MKYLIAKPVHPANFRCLAALLAEIGWGIMVPEWDAFGYGNNPRREHLPPRHNVIVVPSPQHALLKDASFVMAQCPAQVVAAKAMAKNLGVPLALYACNNNVAYDPRDSDHILCEDFITYWKTEIKNRTLFIPPPDYSIFYPLPGDPKGGLLSGIQNFSTSYPDEYKIFKLAAKQFPVSEMINAEWPNDVRSRLRNAGALLHLKPEEASGNLMMEALACGTPVITYNELMSGRTCSFFLQPGVNSWGVNRKTIIEDIQDAIHNLSYLQQNAASTIRATVNNETARRQLILFLHKLKKDLRD